MRKHRKKPGAWPYLALICGVILLLSTAVLLSACTRKVSLTVKAGEPLPDTEGSLGLDVAPFIDAYGADCLNHAGTYTIPMTDADGRKYSLKLTVVDRKAPQVTPKHVYVALGGCLPEAADCIGSILEVDDYTAEFVTPLPDLSELGDYDVTFRVTDASGNKTKELSTIISVIRDTQPPTAVRTPQVSAYVGEALAYRQALDVTDNCCGPLEIMVDSSGVNPSLPGDYTVTYTVTDAMGNRATILGTVHIYANRITEEQLNVAVDALLARITTPNMTVEQKLREAYAYIQDHISYVPDSDKSDWIRAAYDSLFVTGTGDCFNYFAAAKAIVRRLGLDYREIQRTPGLTEETHYWMMVNIGTAAAPQWYHYDCTRLRADYNHSGCLLTDKQINAYNRVRKYFYAYDASRYPASATRIITPTPALEDYY